MLSDFRTKLSLDKICKYGNNNVSQHPVSFSGSRVIFHGGIISRKYRFLMRTTPTREEDGSFNEKLIRICLKLDINPIPRISNYKSNILFIPLAPKYEAEFVVLNNQSSPPRLTSLTNESLQTTLNNRTMLVTLTSICP